MVRVTQAAQCNSLTAAAKGQTNRSHLLSVADGGVCPGNQGPELWVMQASAFQTLVHLIASSLGTSLLLKDLAQYDPHVL